MQGKPLSTEIKQCRACGNPLLESVCDLGTMAFSGVFPKTLTQIVPQGPLELVKCHGDSTNSCGLVQLRHCFDPQILFGESYGYRSGLNQSMREHLRNLARDIENYVELKKNDAVIDIGSNDGTLLNFFAGKDLNLLGIDPASGKFQQYYHKEITVIPEFFSAERIKGHLGSQKAKVITAVAVFYDFNNPLEFLKDIASILAQEGICLLEQSYWPTVLENNTYDTICHEHMAYYGLKQIQWLANQAGLKTIDGQLNSINGGSLRVVLAHKNSAFRQEKSQEEFLIKAEEKLELEALAPYQRFQENVFKHRQILRQTINDLRSQGLSVAGYGASTKGNVLLQFCGLTEKEIPFIAEINQDKWGCFCPGSGIPIIAQEEAKSRKPDVFLVLPWHFKNFILSKEKEYLKQGGSFLFPFPQILRQG